MLKWLIVVVTVVVHRQFLINSTYVYFTVSSKMHLDFSFYEKNQVFNLNWTIILCYEFKQRKIKSNPPFWSCGEKPTFVPGIEKKKKTFRFS